MTYDYANVFFISLQNKSISCFQGRTQMSHLGYENKVEYFFSKILAVVVD